MPKGHHVQLYMKNLIVHFMVDLEQSPEEIYDALFWEGDILTYDSFIALYREIQMKSQEEIDAYVSCDSRTREGKELMLAKGSTELEYLLYLNNSHRSMSLDTLTRKFHAEFYDAHKDQLPSVSTVTIALRGSGQTRKKITWINVRRNKAEELVFMDSIKHVAASRLVDIDGMVQTGSDFERKYGWAAKGQRCIRTQLFIRDEVYAVHAACTEDGFIFWDIFQGTVTQGEVQKFLVKLAKVLPADSYGILDNATNQRTPLVQEALENIFGGMYQYCAPYSPHLKPVERGFSLVKRYIQLRDDDLTKSARELINEAFQYYSVDEGCHGKALYKFFDIYRVNHKLF
jgi:hypothetical protein